ncbi:MULTISPECIES: YciI family protein [Aphanothece]|uniref:YciI family protein n=1 Tax=Aphanothece TaxID=1121 RepID=UPI0039850296
MPWFVKLEEGIVPKPSFDVVVPEHLSWLAELERRGHRPMSGYWADRRGCSGDGAGGMLLFWAGDWAEAEALVRHDPLILAGCVRWTLHEWATVFGAGHLDSP